MRERPLPETDADPRRRRLLGSIAGGFALAVQPVHGQTIVTTDADGLTAGEVRIAVADGEMRAYRAAPSRPRRPLPTVLVVQEIFGVHEHIRDVCRRFAHLGYLAIAPDLYARQGDPTGYPDVKSLIAEIVSKVPDTQVMADLDATVRWAAGHGGDAGRLGITGFCWGGRIVWLYAAHSAGLKAGVAWYGRVVGDSTALTPKHPVDIAKDLKAPVLGLYGGADTGIPNDTVDRMRAALKAGSPAAQKSQIDTYPDTPHAFNADYRPSYRKEQAEDAWKKALAWFKANGV